MKNTITITYGDQAENHVGMQKFGSMAPEGFSINELQKAKKMFETINCKCELINLNDYLGVNAEPAAILIIRNGVSALLEKDDTLMYKEQNALQWDMKVYMYGRVVNKHARHNLCYGDVAQNPDYANKKGRIVPWSDVPLTNKLRLLFKEYLGDKAKNLTAEGNNYYDAEKCGIGYHGDGERRIVIGVRLGTSMPLHYTWFKDSKKVGTTAKLMINGGDIYVMSEKATGNDWKKRSIYTLRHAAGCKKYTTIKVRKKKS